jgi:hypothetical protein
MNIWIRLAVVLCFSFQAFAGPAVSPDRASEARKRLADIYQISRTTGEFLKNSAVSLAPSSSAFLKDKIKGNEYLKISIQEKPGGNFVLTAEKRSFTFSWPEAVNGKIKMKLEGKMLSFNETDSAEKVWRTVSAVFPGKSASHWPSILPEANAEPITLAVIAISVVVSGSLLYFTNQTNCDTYNTWISACLTRYMGYDGFLSAIAFDRDLFNVSLGCDDRKAKLRLCLKEEQDRHRYSLPKDVSEYLRSIEAPVSSEVPAESTN